MLRCLVQNLAEDAILTRWNVILSLVNGTRGETFNLTLLRISTNTQQLPDQIHMRLVSLVFDYLHVFMHIMENEDFNNLNCPMDITQKIDAQMLKNVTYKKLLPFMMLW
ncbi:unnamed protein product, partial [Rotaria sp. Silwood1]